VAEALTFNGLSVDSYAYMIPDISGIMRVPERRGENVAVPGRHGRIRTAGKRFDSNEIVLPFWIVGADPDTGRLPPAEELDAFWANRDALLKILYAENLLIQYTRPNGHTVQTQAEVADVLDFTRRYADPLAQVSVALELLDAFWEDADSVSQVLTGPTDTVFALTEFAAATAPMSDLQITLHGPVNNPQLQHGERWVKFNGALVTGQELRLDTGSWQVSPGAGDPWTPDPRNIEFGAPPNWLELDPSVAPFAVTFTHTTGGIATATIAGRRKYLAP
jgi:hypothetical protein